MQRWHDRRAVRHGKAYQLMKSGVPFRDAYKKVEKEYT